MVTATESKATRLATAMPLVPEITGSILFGHPASAHQDTQDTRKPASHPQRRNQYTQAFAVLGTLNIGGRCPYKLILFAYSGLNWHQTVGACYAPNIIWTQSIGSTVTGAFHIEVQWASSDLKSFSPLAAPLTTASAAPSSSTAAAASTTTTPTPTGPASTRSLAGAAGAAGTTVAANGNNGGGGLSTGAKAGIGVGVAVGVLAIIGAIIFLVYRRRKKSAAEQNTTYSQQPAETSEPQQMPDNQITSAYAHHKPAPAAPTELEGSQAYRTELDSGYQGHEMRSGYK